MSLFEVHVPKSSVNQTKKYVKSDLTTLRYFKIRRNKSYVSGFWFGRRCDGFFGMFKICHWLSINCGLNGLKACYCFCF